MRLGLRRILYIGVFAIFIVIGPAIILYATGFRVMPYSFTVAHVGALYVKSYPAGASVLIDGVDTGKKTPARLLNLTPGDHDVSVSLPEFQAWNKKLPVTASATTFVRDVVLFRSSPLLTNLGSGSSSFVASDESEIIAVLASDGVITLENTETDATFALQPSPAPDRLISLSSDRSFLLYQTNQVLYRFDINSERSERITTVRPGFVKAIAFSGSDPITILESGAIRTVSPSAESEVFEPEGVIDMTRSISGELAILKKTEEVIHVTWFSVPGLVATDDVTITRTDAASIISASGSGIILATTEGQLVYYPRSGGNGTIFSSSDADVRGSRVLLSDNHEVALYDASTANKEFIDRTGEEQRLVRWHPSGSYFSRVRNNSIELVELDGRDRRNSVPLYTSDVIIDYFFNQKGSVLYVLTETAFDKALIQ